jgi:hypothetical protein
MAAKLEAQREMVKDMVGTWGLEPQTSTVSNLEPVRDDVTLKKSE